MRVTTVQLTDFRNYAACTFEPCDGVTVLTGDNAQGKTNALEAVYLTCAGRSHRTRQDRELIRWGAELARVRVEAMRRDGSHEVEIKIPATGRRVIEIAGQRAARSGELMGHITGVLFSPEDLTMVKDGPSERRKFVDIALSQIRPAYYYALQRYARALRQRNALLRMQADQTLDAFDEELARAGAEVMRHRGWYVQLLGAAAGETHRHISGGREQLALEYRPGAGADMLGELRAARQTDMRRMTSTIGAHRDDIGILIDGRDARMYGSQGQQRTAALSLRLSELRVMRDVLGEWPILMLDDVMSELDPARRRSLITYLEGVQTIITCTDTGDLAGAQIGALYRVDRAALTRL
ncbi:MAG: DNA replication/repair protein RecF [Christensenellales bacterium]|jgi:DNA replication and repair protein RecF